MVSGSCGWMSIGNPKSEGRLPLISRQESPASSVRMTSQCFCMNSVSGREGFIAIRCTQWPTSAFGSGMPSDRSPWLIGRQLLPASSLRNAPAAEIATNIRSRCFGSRMIVWRHMPPAPGAQLGAVLCWRRAGSSCQFWPPSVERKRAASSAPA